MEKSYRETIAVRQRSGDTKLKCAFFDQLHAVLGDRDAPWVRHLIDRSLVHKSPTHSLRIGRGGVTLFSHASSDADPTPLRASSARASWPVHPRRHSDELVT